MGDRRFYLFKRKNGVYYAELLNLGGARVLYRSTGSRDRDEALLTVADWLQNGITITRCIERKSLKEAADFKSVMKFIKTSDINEEQALTIALALKNRGLLAVGVSRINGGKQDLIKFLLNFWDYDHSVYLKDKRLHGKSVTKRTCVESARLIKHNWVPYFGDKKLAEVTRQELRDFGISLSEDGKASGTINNVLSVGTIALRWAYLEKIIPENITERLDGFVGGEKKRDILTQDEAAKLLDNDRYWKESRPDRQESSEKAYIAAILAATSALRSGECRALRRCDIGDSVVYVRHGYNSIDGLKTTKNEESNAVYLLPKVRNLLINLLDKSPHKGIDPAKQFVFWGNNPKKPISAQTILKYFHAAVKRAELDLGERDIDFHSFRHFVATAWADETGDLRQVQKVTRHKDVKQTARYADHLEEQKIAAMGETAANILPFSTEKGA